MQSQESVLCFIRFMDKERTYLGYECTLSFKSLFVWMEVMTVNGDC